MLSAETLIDVGSVDFNASALAEFTVAMPSDENARPVMIVKSLFEGITHLTIAWTSGTARLVTTSLRWFATSIALSVKRLSYWTQRQQV